MYGLDSPDAISFVNVSDEAMAMAYLSDFQIKLENIQSAYQLLDEQYAKKRFSSIENFKKYITSKQEQLKKAYVAKYKITPYKDFTQYICIDQFGNYYIFNETAIMKYSVILDTYTIDLPQYIENYNKANTTTKVGMCVDRFMKAVNDENYEFAYSLLASGFKNNYFKTKEEFITYAKQNLVGRDKITHKAINSQDEIYLYTVILENEETMVNPKELTFIVKLKDGTNFELSFEMQ